MREDILEILKKNLNLDQDTIDQMQRLDTVFGKNPCRAGNTLVSAEYDEVFESMKWMKELPYLSFPSTWLVKITPPFVGAVIRFRVTKESLPKDRHVSIYFDGYNNLGHASGPYWEIYPGICGDLWDTERFLLGEEKEMLEAIEESLKAMEKKDV